MNNDEIFMYMFTLKSKLNDTMKKYDRLVSKIYEEVYNKGIEFACKTEIRTLFSDLQNLKYTIEHLQDLLEYKQKFTYPDIKEFLSVLSSLDISPYLKGKTNES